MKLSENFSVDEFISSSTATRLGYQFTLDPWEYEQIKRLVQTCLQPAREALDVPFVITSGFRPTWLNKHIRGAKDSRHMYGCAADFKTPTLAMPEAFEQIRALDLPLDQLILEAPPNGWLHLGIALPGEEPRKQYMIATRNVDGRMMYHNAE